MESSTALACWSGISDCSHTPGSWMENRCLSTTGRWLTSNWPSLYICANQGHLTNSSSGNREDLTNEWATGIWNLFAVRDRKNTTALWSVNSKAWFRQAPSSYQKQNLSDCQEFSDAASEQRTQSMTWLFWPPLCCYKFSFLDFSWFLLFDC